MEFVKSVLLIDDNPSCNFIMNEFIKLADPNIQVYEADSVEDALEILAKLDSCPDVIYVDVNMPVMNGFDFIEYFEKSYSLKNPNCKIFMLSSSLRAEDKERALAHSCVKDFVSKNDIDSFLQHTLMREVA
ncbi:MAG: response regulator [Flavobacteriaceae bacterium]|nr:response regulator [Flavobacteriales bacterium]MDP4665768.1 response regulator [Flavobacteriaceae bacterium]